MNWAPRLAGVEPASTWPSTRPVYQIAARAHGASGRSRTACLSLTRGPLCQVSYRGMAAHHGFEPRLTDPESVVLPIERMGIGCGRRESNAQATRFELVRYASSLHSRLVRHLGLEPRTFGLRVRCSAIALAALGADGGTRTRVISLEG